MSFVITAVRPENVVQVSETRHSDLETKHVISENLRKTFAVKGSRTHFVLGWIGLASSRFGHNTTDWLFKALGEMNAVELTIEQIATSVGGLATSRFADHLSVAATMLKQWQRRLKMISEKRLGTFGNRKQLSWSTYHSRQNFTAQSRHS